MPIQTKRIYDPPAPADGHRVLTMRYWPRGIRKELVDSWDRGLAPSSELLADYRTGAIDWPGFTRRYRHEMTTRPDSIEAIAALRERASGETVTVMCGCKDETHCHRALLKEIAFPS